jgi:hypothetical protein
MGSSRGRIMATIQNHHIKYQDMSSVTLEWVIELRGWQHRAITILQRMNPTEENYASAINFLHSIMHEVNRIREGLDNEMDLV